MLSCFKPKLFLPLKLLDCWRMVPQKLNLMARGKEGSSWLLLRSYTGKVEDPL